MTIQKKCEKSSNSTMTRQDIQLVLSPGEWSGHHQGGDRDNLQCGWQGWEWSAEHQGVPCQLQGSQHGQGGRELLNFQIFWTKKVINFLRWVSCIWLRYCDFRKGSQPPTPQDKAEMAFKLYDKDKDGYITRAEMVKLSKTLTKEQVEKVFVMYCH